jgi:hypothetical protein
MSRQLAAFSLCRYEWRQLLGDKTAKGRYEGPYIPDREYFTLTRTMFG